MGGVWHKSTVSNRLGKKNRKSGKKKRPFQRLLKSKKKRRGRRVIYTDTSMTETEKNIRQNRERAMGWGNKGAVSNHTQTRWMWNRHCAQSDRLTGCWQPMWRVTEWKNWIICNCTSHSDVKQRSSTFQFGHMAVTEVHRKDVLVWTQWLRYFTRFWNKVICLMKNDEGSQYLNLKRTFTVLVFSIFGDILWQEYRLTVIDSKGLWRLKGDCRWRRKIIFLSGICAFFSACEKEDGGSAMQHCRQYLHKYLGLNWTKMWNADTVRRSLTIFSFSTGISKTHLSLESISSSGLASFHWENQQKQLSLLINNLFNHVKICERRYKQINESKGKDVLRCVRRGATIKQSSRRDDQICTSIILFLSSAF